MPSTWKPLSVPKMLLVNSPHPEKGQLMTILGWSISCHINTESKVVLKFPIWKRPESTPRRHSHSAPGIRLVAASGKWYFQHLVFNLTYFFTFFTSDWLRESHIAIFLSYKKIRWWKAILSEKTLDWDYGKN